MFDLSFLTSLSLQWRSQTQTAPKPFVVVFVLYYRNSIDFCHFIYELANQCQAKILVTAFWSNNNVQRLRTLAHDLRVQYLLSDPRIHTNLSMQDRP